MKLLVKCSWKASIILDWVDAKKTMLSAVFQTTLNSAGMGRVRVLSFNSTCSRISFLRSREMYFLPCSRLRASSAFMATPVCFLRTAGGTRRVSRRRENAMYAPFWGGSSRHSASSMSSKLTQPRDRSSEVSSISRNACCLSLSRISPHRDCGTGSVMRKRVKLLLDFKKAMALPLEKLARQGPARDRADQFFTAFSPGTPEDIERGAVRLPAYAATEEKSSMTAACIVNVSASHRLRTAATPCSSRSSNSAATVSRIFLPGPCNHRYGPLPGAIIPLPINWRSPSAPAQ
ncbi:hypothetical protein KL86DPRO_50129 [uncultured delta proteobacterium]|uniref:Uncharacterized protein n=1 Tax=uncultured delta proteobacterium TaxID=34034 RepID=A0A212KCP5_9DELT|nr:hypothetical protein KL86DPRO_50129 [uncultured delta proteobacterium]